MDAWALLIAATLNAGTLVALAALGLLINERAGVVNLGAEGMMLVAAIAGFAAAVHSGSDLVGFLAGIGAGALMALVFGALAVYLNTNQYATGLALSLFGSGFSAFVGIRYTQEKLAERARFDIPGLSDIAFVGPAFFRHHPMVYIAIALTIALAWFLYRSRAGDGDATGPISVAPLNKMYDLLRDDDPLKWSRLRDILPAWAFESA